MKFTKPKKVVGLDVGSHAVKAVQMSQSGGKLCIDDIGYSLVDTRQSNVDPIAAQATALREALQNLSVNQSMMVGALPGQTVVIRYPRLRNVDAANIDKAIEEEARQNIPYDLYEVSLDWSLLDEEKDGDENLLKVLLVAAKDEVIDTRVQIADAAGINFNCLSVDSLALADAVEGCKLLSADESVALINIGAGSVSIHFMKDGSSNFIRDISWGAKEMINAIAKSRRCDFEEAEAILFNYDAEMARAAQSVEATPVIEPSAPPALSGEEGSSELEELGGDLDELDTEPDGVQEAQLDPIQDIETLDEVLANPVSKLVSEVRRSFDYYEHQLYERPVERIILSGGVAHLPPIKSALSNDLGVESIEVADPCSAGLRTKNLSKVPEFEEHPAQFMVAIGLAARGAAEL